MTNDSYVKALISARRALIELLKAREELNLQITKVGDVIESLAALCEETPAEPKYPQESETYATNLRDNIRFVFNAEYPKSLSPTEVRDKLRENGFPLDRYKYELPPIHNTIARLESAGEIEPVIRLDGDRAYKFVSSLKRAIKDTKEEEKKIQDLKKL